MLYLPTSNFNFIFKHHEQEYTGIENQDLQQPYSKSEI